MWKKKHAPGSPTPATPKMKTLELGPTPSPASFNPFKRGILKPATPRAPSPSFSLLSSPTVVASPPIIAPTPRLPPSKIIVPPSPAPKSHTIHAPTPRMAAPHKQLLESPLNSPAPPTPAPRTPATPAPTRMRPILKNSRHHRRYDSDDYAHSDAEGFRTPMPRRRSSPPRPASTRPDRQPSVASSMPSTYSVPTPHTRSRRMSNEPATPSFNMVTLPLHWQLLPWHSRNGKPRLEFDIVNPPSRIMMRPGLHMPARTIRDDELRKPACRGQSVSALTLVLDKYLHWPIHARASSSGGVTCEDIFNAIYETFQVPLTEAEIAEIKRDRAVHDRVDHAFRRRCKRSVRLTEYEKSKGYRRVDVLGDRTWFFGMLQPINPELGYYILSLESALPAE